jgi:DeoR family suf operon transcriptional repressor
MTVTDFRRSSESTREVILRALKTNNGASVPELAKLADVSAVTVRHHISSLQADGLVEVGTDQRHSVGRPRHIYYLTDSGEELFPRHYLGLTKRLLDQVKTSLSPEAVSQLFELMADDILSGYTARLQGASQGERLALLAEILENEGFIVSWEETDGEQILIGHSCPYRNLGREHPDICTIDHTLITKVLGTPAQRTSCLLQGDNQCTYVINS